MVFQEQLYEEVGELGNSGGRRTVLLRGTQGNFLVYKEVGRESVEIFRILKNNPHPNIVSVLGMKSVDEETCGIFMEYIMADTLDDKLIQEGRIPLKRAKEIMLQICQAVGHFQNLGIIHRDLKPLNILVLNDGGVKITDFGIARIYKKDKIGDTRILGTAGYAAPEQFGFSQTSEKADIYALGVILNRMLTGKMPAQELYNGDTQIGAVIRKCIRMSPEERCSLEEFVEALGGTRIKGKGLGRRILRKIPGFRTGNPVHMTLAAVEYAYMLFLCSLSVLVSKSLEQILRNIVGFLIMSLGVGWCVGSFGKVSYCFHMDRGVKKVLLILIYGIVGVVILGLASNLCF